MCASIKEDSQKTTTLTDNKKVDYENEGSAMNEDSFICFNYSHTHVFPKCCRSLHTLLGNALYSVSSIFSVAVTINSILTCTRILCRDSHCETSLLRCCLYTRPVGYSGPPSAESNAIATERRMKNKFVKVVRLRFDPKTANNKFLRSIMSPCMHPHLSTFFEFFGRIFSQ